MKITKRKLEISNVIHGLAYTLIIINLFFMNFNVLIGKPVYFMMYISLSLIAMLLCIVVLFMRKETDSTPLFGVLVIVYAFIIVVVLVLYFMGTGWRDNIDCVY